MEEAEEAEPDEEFKDAIEVGSPSPPPSTDHAGKSGGPGAGWLLTS